MQPIRCESSLLLTKLLLFRNPVARQIPLPQEDDYLLRPKFINVITTEICLFLLAATSIIETLTYASLTFLYLFLYPFTDKPFLLHKKLLESSSFTIIWSLADAVIFNLFSRYVTPNESFARYWADQFNPTPLRLFRDEDFSYVRQEMLLNSLLRAPQTVRTDRASTPTLLQEEVINKGANFIKDKVLAGADKETIRIFMEMDPDIPIFLFIATKAAYIYGFGELKNKEIPPFFKPKTKEIILQLRGIYIEYAQNKELLRLFENPMSFDSQPVEQSTLNIFNLLRKAGSSEVDRAGIFITKCYEKATALFDPEASSDQ
jgi:hypothetical protein